MDILITLLCLLLTLFLIRFLAGSNRTCGKLPPGPKPYPVIGNILDFGKKPHQSLAQLAKTYGPIMSLKLGQVTAIVVSSASMAKEFLHTHDQSISTYRAVPDALTALNFDDYSMGFIPVSNHWRILRRTWNSHIFSSKKLDGCQNVRRKKVQELVSKLEEKCRTRTAVDIGELSFKTTANFLSNTIFSTDLVDPDADTSQGLKEMVCAFMEDAGKPNLADFFPVLKKIDPQGIKRRMTILIGKLLDRLSQLVKQRMKFREATGSTMENDILDIILNICEDDNEEFQKEWIGPMFMDIFLAGNDTSSSTLEWAMAELLRNQETLLKAQAELRETIPKGKLVEESDLYRLPYLQAVLKETLRLHPPVPFLVPRKAGADVEICGYTTPKGSHVFINAWAIGRDPNTWDDPNTFKPERFLGSERDYRDRSFEFIPFGGGRRTCPGLPLAVRMVPLILASLIHSFDWKLEDGVKPEDINMDDRFGITLSMEKPLIAIPVPI